VQRRNFTLGVLNGVFFTLVTAFVSPTLVLALFVSKLGGSNLLVGLLPAIATGGYLLPQLFVAGRMQALPKVMGWYGWPGVVRCVAYALLVVATLLLGGSSDNYGLLLLLFFVLYTIYSLTAGLGGVPWIVMVGKVVPPRRRGLFFGLRNFGGSILALFASGLIKVLLDGQGGLAFPINFVIIFAITTILVTLGVGSWTLIKEPAQRAVTKASSLMAMIRRGPQNLRADRSYRYFLIARILLALATIADPFYIVYASKQLNAPDSVAGLYAAALTVASIVGNLIWSPLADYAGNRRMMLLTGVAVTAVPAMAVLIPLLAAAGWLGWVINIPGVSGFAGSSGSVISVPFALVFVFSGFAASAAGIINNNVMLNIAPPQLRSEYIGYLNTVLGLITFIPVIGGLLVDWLGFVPVFIVAAALALGATFSALGLNNQRFVE
jgi:MFS family permease